MKEISYNRKDAIEYARKWAYGSEVNQDKIELGDIAQLSFDGIRFSHSLIIVKIENKIDLNQIFISSHTFDSFNKKISEYNYEKIRFIHIEKVRKY